jgi:cytochrome P450
MVARTASRPTGASLQSPALRDQVRLIRGLFREPQPVLDEIGERFGSMCSMGAGPLRMAIVGEPSAMRELFAIPNDQFRWGHKFNVLGFVVGPQSLIVSDGDEHRRRRGAVQAAFSRRRLNQWIPMIVERTDAAIDAFVATLPAEGTTRDLYPIGRRLVLEIAARAFFGERMAARVDELSELFELPQAYLEGTAYQQIPHRIPRTRRARVRENRRALVAIVEEQIASRRAQPSGDPFDVLEALALSGDLSDSEICDQVITLIGAGYDTTAASLAWILWCVALAPDVWADLRVEADQVFGAGAANEQTLAQLDLASRVMRETTRLHPAGVVAPREAAVDMVIGGSSIAKGTLIMWSAYLAGRDPKIWPDPTRFDPSRWLDMPDDQRAISDAAWVPFGRGTRNCIGFALAQMELTLIVSRLAQRIDLQPTVSDMPRAVGLVVNRPFGGAPMRVAPRASIA